MTRIAATRHLLLLFASLCCATAQAGGLDPTEQRIVRAADGRQAHSSGIFREQQGYGAILEAARKGGTASGKTSVIARDVRVAGDLRFLSAEQYAAASSRASTASVRSAMQPMCPGSTSRSKQWPCRCDVRPCCSTA